MAGLLDSLVPAEPSVLDQIIPADTGTLAGVRQYMRQNQGAVNQRVMPDQQPKFDAIRAELDRQAALQQTDPRAYNAERAMRAAKSMIGGDAGLVGLEGAGVAKPIAAAAEMPAPLAAVAPLKPAIKDEAGVVTVGQPGQIHADIAETMRPGVGALAHGSDAWQAGFVDANGNFVDRNQASAALGQPRSLEATDLNAGGMASKPAMLPPDLAGNINLNNITGPDEIKNLLVETAQTNAEFMGERRGVIPLDQQKQLAADVGMTPEELMTRSRGTAFNAENAIAARQLLTQSAADVMAKAKAAQGGADADIVAFQEALTRHRAIQEQVAGITAEAGRALGSFRVKAGTDAAKALKNIIEQSGGRQNIEDIATAVSNLDPQNLGTFAANVFRPTWKDKAKTLWLNLILSNPVSHAANTASNFLTLFGSQVPEAFGQAAVQAARGGGLGGFTQAATRLYGYVAGSREGLANAWKTIRTGESPESISKMDTGRAQPFLQGSQYPLVRAAGRVPTIATTAMTAEDELFKGMASRGEIYSQAAGIAGSEKLTPGTAAWRQRVKELANNPTPEMLDAAAKHSEYVTFQTPLGPAGQAFMNWRSKTPGAYIFAPFVKTPTNILKYALERTPAGIAMKPVRDNLMGINGPAARDAQIARIGLGTAAATAIASWAAEGKITGAGNPDPNLKALERSYGERPPYSIKIGDTWYSYRRLDPFASVIGPIADIVELSKDIPEMDAGKATAAIVTSLANNLVNKTYLQGLSDVAAALNDPAQYGQRLVDSLAGSAIPAGVAQEARVEDPVLRDTQTTLDYLRSRLPGHSQDLAPRITILGDIVPREGSFGPGIVSPINTSKPSNDPVVKEMLRLKTAPGRPDRKIMGADLTPHQYSEYMQLGGALAKQMLAQVIASPGWQKMPDGLKIDTMRSIFDQTRKSAAAQMLAKYPDLLRGSITKSVQKYTMPPQPFSGSFAQPGVQ